MPSRRQLAASALAVICLVALPAHAEDRTITVASTTSTQDSGLFGYLLPAFKKRSGIAVRVVAQGTGQALDTGRRGDVDVVFVHDRAQEEKFVTEGFGVRRYPVMYNDFIIVGPKQDPARISGLRDVTAALKAISAKGGPFISRGDKSGTHSAELRLWKAAGVDVNDAKGGWYRSIGQGMGATLNTAAASGGYALTDRATWLAFKNKGDLKVLVEGDNRLFNQYGVILVNPQKHRHVNAKDGQIFVDWLVSPEGQKAIAAYRIGGRQLFFPNANAPGV